MASFFSIRLSPLFSHSRICELDERIKLGANVRHISNNDEKLHNYFGFSRSNLVYESTQKHHSSTSHVGPSKLLLSRALSSTVSTSADSDQTNSESQLFVSPQYNPKVDFNRVSCLVWVLHESASSFSLAIDSLELARKDPELAMAWVGVDAQAWHKHVAYQVAVYALLKAVIEVELVLSHKRNNPSSVQHILSQMTFPFGESIESQLNIRQPILVQWFKTVELPRIAGIFIPLLKKWAIDYAGRSANLIYNFPWNSKLNQFGVFLFHLNNYYYTSTQLIANLSSGVAGIILAISCCAAVKKFGSGRLSNVSFSVSIEDVLIELMDLAHGLVSVDKLHHLAIEAGFEEEFLMHFGRKVLLGKGIAEVEFWIGLVHRKLSTAFHRESVISGKQTFCDEVQEKGLATLGLFAFLGRKTRLFLSGMGVKDLDEHVKDFLSYLECGSLLMHPEFSSLSEYQLFMEVVTDEIGWLDFYAPFSSTYNEERRRSKQHALQAEQELILYTVFTVCYDVFSGFAHFSNSTKQQLDANLLEFLLQSQSLLSTCLKDYRAAYDGSGELSKIADGDNSGFSPSSQILRRTNSSALLESHLQPIDLMKSGGHEEGSMLSKIKDPTAMDPRMHQEVGHARESESLPKSLLKKSTIKLMSASADVWMGTQLLFIDILDAMGYLMKQLRGRKITNRERKKIERTLADLASLVPITILMLIPVSAVGHAAILAAIQKYTPSMIPSPYSPERLDVVKQLKRAKKMEVETNRSTTLNEEAST